MSKIPVISIGEMLQAMEAGDICSLMYYTYNRQLKKGGEPRLIIQGRMLTREPKEGDNLDDLEYRGERDSSAMERINDSVDNAPKYPNHTKWDTRNIRIYANGHPTSLINKIHPLLVQTFNGARVL